LASNNSHPQKHTIDAKTSLNKVLATKQHLYSILKVSKAILIDSLPKKNFITARSVISTEYSIIITVLEQEVI
jgi:hypothetical protein